MQHENVSHFSKIAVITGAGGLLGKVHAEALLELDLAIAISDINLEALGPLYDELSKLFPNSTIIPLKIDVTDKSSILEASDLLKEMGFQVTCLINNASINPQPNSLSTNSRFESFSLDQWNKELEVGLTGSFLCSQVFGSEMARNGLGVILNIASDLSVIAPNQDLYRVPGLRDGEQPVKPVSYSVAKTALVGLTRYLSTYWAKTGVRVNALSPGGVENGQNSEFKAKLEVLIPLGRMANLKDIKGAVKFLCSSESEYVTGINLVVDGGRSVW